MPVPESTSARVLLGLLIAGVLAIGLEWLIVTDREAVENTLASSLQAIEQKDTDRLLKQIHPTFRVSAKQAGIHGRTPKKVNTVKKKHLEPVLRNLFQSFSIRTVHTLDQKISFSENRATVDVSVLVMFNKKRGRSKPAGTMKYKSDFSLTLEPHESDWLISAVKRTS